MTTLEKTKYPVQSSFVSLNNVVEQQWTFDVPIYQRLYVWTSDHIRMLLDDLYKAFDSQADKYYVGGVIFAPSHSDKEPGKFYLIDGQQRFTTFWLIGKELRNKFEPFNYIQRGQKQKARIQFNLNYS